MNELTLFSIFWLMPLLLPLLVVGYYFSIYFSDWLKQFRWKKKENSFPE